ncbi:hypothetical protein TIFTF001_023066 [Ficus carica]|uniref:Uncharacterized protein n=1 Tax=Ficus carica TaxID=3494 RepID=A0AA88DG02_FICCA|nr:hypothetical protein TIFTF001_023066 [Ficus carica]
MPSPASSPIAPAPPQHAGHRAHTRAVTGARRPLRTHSHHHRPTRPTALFPPPPPPRPSTVAIAPVTGQHAQLPLYPPQHPSHRAPTGVVTSGEEEREREKKECVAVKKTE